MDTEPSLSVFEAAKQIGLTSQRIRVLLYEDRIPGAFKDSSGKWQIPQSALDEMRQKRQQAVSA